MSYSATGLLAGQRSRWRLARSVLAAMALELRAAPLITPFLFGLTLLVGALPAGTAWLTKLLLDELAKGTAASGTHAVTLAICAAGIGGLSALMLRLTGYTTLLVKQRITVAVERELYAKVIRFGGLRYFEEPAFHDRLRIAERASREAPQSIASFSQETVRCATTVASYAGALWVVSPRVTLLLVAVGSTALVAQLGQAHRQARVVETVTRNYRRRSFYRALLTEPKAAKEIRLFGIGWWMHRRLIRSLCDANRVELEAERHGSLIQASLVLLSATVTAVGAVLVVRGTVLGRFTVGDVILFFAAVTGIQGAFAGIVSQAGAAGRGARLFGHYVDVLTAPDDVPTGTLSVPPLHKSIEFRDVWFRYDSSSPWVLRGVDLVLSAGSVLGLVGVNGAGKSTLVKLLCRFYDPDRGQILWDGTDLRQLDLGELRSRIGATFQDFMTYDLTAKENVGLGDVARMDDEARIRCAARLAGIDSTLTRLPAGYQTLLSRVYHDDADNFTGATLSGGQWQRLALARSLMRTDADVLILDEPSSGLDADAEYRLNRTLRDHTGGRTRLLVSSTLR